VTKRILLSFLSVSVLLLCEPPQEIDCQTIKASSVPSKYRRLYSELDQKLQGIDRFLTKQWNGQKYPMAFSVELLAANSHHGEALLREETFEANVMMLDRLRSLGVRGIMLGILYPVLNPSFHRSADYLNFYKRLAFEIRQRDLKLIVETTSTFREPEFSDVKVDYSGLTMEKYKREKRQMIEKIIREMRPDYLTVDNEPLTQQRNTGLLFSVRNYTEMIQYILKDLDRSGVKLGAGSGTWDHFDYFESLAKNTPVDYIDMHLYPIQRDFVIDRTLRIERLARAQNKMLTVGEAWLYKAAESEFAGLEASQPQVFARDVFDFWIPLDEKFLEVMVTLSHHSKLEFCSLFWMRYLYGYLQYNHTTRGMKPLQLFRQVNGLAYKNMLTGTLSQTGMTFQRLIGETQ
jgi:hypothetical protein